MLNVKKTLTKVLEKITAHDYAYIVEKGTNGSWSYTKYSDGTYEAYYTAGMALNAGSGGYGGYYHKSTYGLPLPSFAKTWSLKSAIKGDGVISWCLGVAEESDGLHFYWMTTTSASVYGSNFVNTNITIIGTW